MFLNFKTQSKKYNLYPQRAYNHSNDRERERFGKVYQSVGINYKIL